MVLNQAKRVGFRCDDDTFAVPARLLPCVYKQQSKLAWQLEAVSTPLSMYEQLLLVDCFYNGVNEHDVL